MPKESIIKHYSSSTTGSVPLAADLVEGELAINTADERIYFENASGQVVNFGESKGISATYARRSSVVSSLNGLTGALNVTGTANEIEVAASTPNIVVGLRDSVTINNLTVTTTVTADNFVGSLLGKVSTPCKNMQGYTLTAGTPVYISGYVGGGASGVLEVKAALAGSAAAMPAVGLVETTLAPNDQGELVELGLLGSLNTSGYNINQVAFVGEFGGLTSNRPTGGNVLVQNIGRVVNSSSTQGEIIVLGPGRSNDVPNNITVRGFLEMPNGQTATSIVTTVNGLSGPVTLTGDGGAIVGVANNAVRARLATASLTGVASFPATDFAVSAAGAVSVTGNFVRTVVVGGSTLTGNVSMTAGSNITLTPSGNTITIASTASGGGGVTTTAQNTWTATQYFNAGLSATGATFTGNQTVGGSLIVTNGITFGSGTTFMEFIPRGSASPASSGGGLWIRGGDLQIGGTDWGDPGLFSFRGWTETHQLYGNFTLNTPESYQAAQNTLTLNTSSSHTGRPLRISRGTGNFIAGCEPNGTWFGAGMQEISSLAGLTFSANPIRMAGLGMDWSYTDIMAGTFVTVTPTSGGGNKPTQITFDDMKVIADDGLAIGAGAINARTGTAGYTLVAGDNGKVITIDSASAVTLTAGTAVGTTGFSCSVIQLGAGQVTIAGSGVTLNSFSGLKIAGQHGAASIVCYATNTLNVAGNLTT